MRRVKQTIVERRRFKLDPIDRIKTVISENKNSVIHERNPQFPQCGFIMIDQSLKHLKWM